MPLRTWPRDVASNAGGAALATAARAVAAVRPSLKPLHPQGQLVVGRLRRCGLDTGTGVAWLDEPGEDEVLVRRSRAVGLPRAVPDIHGLAIRVPLGEDDHGDLLFASTGYGRVSRFVLTASRSPEGRPLTTLLPYRSPRGPLLLGARASGVETFELSCAVGSDPWQYVGDLQLTPTGVDATISFDPVQHQIPGLAQYRWVSLLREPSYRIARRSR